MSNVPRTQGDESARLKKAVEGMLHTIATQVPRDAPFSFMLTRDVAEVSRALATLDAARPAPAWSGEAPTKPGEAWWFREDSEATACLVETFMRSMPDGSWALCFGGRAADGIVANERQAEWYGPLPPPGAAS